MDKANKAVFDVNAQCCDIMNHSIKEKTMNYNLDPKRETPYIVIDDFDEVGMEGVYAGTYEDCEMYMEEQAKHCSCVGMDFIPNSNYKMN